MTASTGHNGVGMPDPRESVGDGLPDQFGDIDDQTGSGLAGFLGIRTSPVHTQTASFSRR
jgi:hypothetical protein